MEHHTTELPTTLKKFVGLGFGRFSVYNLSDEEISLTLRASMNGDFMSVEELTSDDERSTYDTCRDFIGNMLDVAYFNIDQKRYAVFCDDEGLLHTGKCLGWQVFADGVPDPIILMGRLVFIGDTDDEGNTLSCDHSVSDITELLAKGKLVACLFGG